MCNDFFPSHPHQEPEASDDTRADTEPIEGRTDPEVTTDRQIIERGERRGAHQIPWRKPGEDLNQNLIWQDIKVTSREDEGR